MLMAIIFPTITFNSQNHLAKKKKPLLGMYHTIWANTTSSYNVYKVEMGLKMENVFGNVF